MSFLKNFFVSIDQLGNVIAGGNPDNTISSRIGYYTQHHERKAAAWYWRFFEWVVNTAFYPIDGKDHCHEAFHNDAGETFDEGTSNIFVMLILTIIILPSCLIIGILLYSLYLFRIVNPKKINRNENIIARLASAEAKLNGTLHELNEHKVDITSSLSVELKKTKATLEQIEMKINGMTKLQKRVNK